MDDLETTIRLKRAAVDTADHPHDRYFHLDDLGDLLYKSFLRTGSISDLDESKRAKKASVDALKDDLEEAIRTEHNAVNATPENHPDRTLHLHNLGNRLHKLFRRTKAISDLEEAIRIGQAAVDATPENSAERAGRLANLGVRLRDRFDRTGSMDDLEKSIRIVQATVDATPESHPCRAIRLHSLGNGLHALFLVTRSMDDLGKAIRIGQAAVDAAKDFSGPSDQGLCLSGLGGMFLSQYRETGSADDLDKAILSGQAAINTTPEDHPDRALRLTNLGNLLWDRFHRNQSMEDVHEAFVHYTEALYDSSSPHFDCLRSGMQAAHIASWCGQYEEGAQYLTECLDLLPMIIRLSNSHEDLQYILRQLSGLGSLAASVFLKAGRSVSESLQALEKSRAIISSIVIDSRCDESMLEERHPDLWSRYCYLREWIAVSTLPSAASNSPYSSPLPGGHYSSVTLARNLMIKELDVIKIIIRKTPEFDRFQLPLTEVELHDLAQYGPIVSFNVTRFGSHAFLITEKNLEVLPLPKLILEDIHKHTSGNKSGNQSRRDAKLVAVDGSSKIEGSSHANTQTESMRWLWDVAIQPVLEKLGLLWQHKPPHILPCLWWVGGGLMALLPLHAAGDHQLGSTENTMSHIVSSYMPSLKALQFSRKKTWTPPVTKDSKILIIKMHKTLGYADLNVEEEVTAIQQHIGSSAFIEVLETPTAATVLEQLSACSLVHFACHGASDVDQPSKSALLLGARSVEKLTIGDLQALNHQLAQVAYLSACSTAEIGGQALIDESINMATTFQLAGFRHVIGTLWGAFDSAAVAVAGKFYEHLLKQNADTVSSVPYALHHAVLDLRAENSNSDNISLWAPFIHIGP